MTDVVSGPYRTHDPWTIVRVPVHFITISILVLDIVV
eukprot:COSAG06_NODE_38900_length_418_cov_1.068966_1_plen_36_part_10